MLALSSPCTQRTRHPRGPLAVVTLAGVSVFAAGCMATAAPSAPAPVDRERQQYSADGVAWGGTDQIPWDTTTVPVPGGEPNSTSFQLRVSGDTKVDGEVYLGNWSIDRGSAWFRVDVDGVPGETVTLPGGVGPGVLMREFSLPAGDSVLVTLKVGLPFGETEQTARITSDWGIALHEHPNSGGGSGSAGSSGSSGGGGSLGSSGGSGSLGSPGSSSGSTGSITTGSLGSPSLGSD